MAIGCCWCWWSLAIPCGPGLADELSSSLLKCLKRMPTGSAAFPAQPYVERLMPPVKQNFARLTYSLTALGNIETARKDYFCDKTSRSKQSGRMSRILSGAQSESRAAKQVLPSHSIHAPLKATRDNRCFWGQETACSLHVRSHRQKGARATCSASARGRHPLDELPVRNCRFAGSAIHHVLGPSGSNPNFLLLVHTSTSKADAFGSCVVEPIF